MDILGVWAVKRMRAKSVGSISLGVNVIIYLLLLLSFRFETFVYSIIYLLVFTLTLDRTHYQNINLRLMIFTKHCGVDRVIMGTNRPWRDRMDRYRSFYKRGNTYFGHLYQ